MFAYLGLILVGITWLAGAFMLTKWRGENRPTISRHASSTKGAYWLFLALLVGGGSVFYVWLVDWFAPHLQLGTVFKSVLTLVILCQIVTAVVPDIGERRKLVHHLAASIMCVLYIPLATLILTSSRLSLLARIVVVVAAAYMVVALVWVVILNRNRDRFLLFQTLYVMIFQSAILTAAYL